MLIVELASIQGPQVFWWKGFCEVGGSLQGEGYASDQQNHCHFLRTVCAELK